MQLKEYAAMLNPDSRSIFESDRIADPAQELQTSDSMRVGLLDAKSVRSSCLQIRDESHYKSASFAALKQSIAQAHGNVQPILVRPAGGQFEVVFGHRRHRACLELGLPVTTVVMSAGVNDREVLEKAIGENLARDTPSSLEMGRHFKRLLDASLFPSVRRLAEALGLSHTWVNALLKLAGLPDAVLDAFPDPFLVQPVQARKLADALQIDEGAVMSRATELMCHGSPRASMSTAAVTNYLLGIDRTEDDWKPLIEDDVDAGRWRLRKQGCLELQVKCQDPVGFLSKIRSVVAAEARTQADGSGPKYQSS